MTGKVPERNLPSVTMASLIIIPSRRFASETGGGTGQGPAPRVLCDVAGEGGACTSQAQQPRVMCDAALIIEHAACGFPIDNNRA
jgi:hypothetical protein